MGLCPYKLAVLHALQGVYKAHHNKFFDFDTFNVDE
jgi:hypothetical protein